MTKRDDRAIAAALDTPEGDTALEVIAGWDRESRHTVNLIRRAINRAYKAVGMRAPDRRAGGETTWEPRS